MLQNFRVHNSMRSDYSIAGDTLIEAIIENFASLARTANIGNAAGYRLNSVEASYATGILGGKGGCEVTIKWREQHLAHRTASEAVHTSTVWIEATPDDIPEPHTFDLAFLAR